jgi:hypothetical protein
MAEKRGQPPSILRVGFVPLAFPLFGVGQHDCETILQDVEDRFPVTTRTFQDRLRTALAQREFEKGHEAASRRVINRIMAT